MSADLHTLDGRVAIVGAGLAGLMTALRLAPRPVVVVSKTPLGAEGSTLWAQGGLAAALGADDSPELHAADTLAAGDGLCVADVVERFTCAAPQAIEELARLGVAFDRGSDGGFALGLEAAHGRRRIVHAGGDGTGREVMRALVAAARRTPSIRALEGFEARRLVVEDGAVRGLLVVGPQGALTLAADKVVIATGGVGGLYEVSTNPGGSFGQGLALAARAGAELADLEFVQFHPTAFDGPARPAPLVSEAVRGEGAVLIDETGERFMLDAPGAELAPRDVVARAIWRRRAEGHRVFLDARRALGDRFAKRFPVIAAFCREAGIDPARAADPGAARRALSHGRNRRRRRGAQFAARPVGVRGSRLDRPARRQSPGEQFLDRGGGVRRARRRQRRRGFVRARGGAARDPTAARRRPERRAADPFRRRGGDARGRRPARAPSPR